MDGTVLQFTEEFSEEEINAWFKAYSLIPKNLAEILKKNNRIITIQKASYEKLRDLQGKDTTNVVSSACTDYKGIIYILNVSTPEIETMIHEIGHQIFWAYDQEGEYIEERKQFYEDGSPIPLPREIKGHGWVNLWTEIHKKHGEPIFMDFYSFPRVDELKSAPFVSAGEAIDYHEGFAEMVVYLSGINEKNLPLENPDLQQKIQFVKNIKSIHSDS